MARSGAVRNPGMASPSSPAIASRSSPARELPGDASDAQSRYIEAAVQRRADRLALCAERQPAARPEIRLQARVDEAARSPCRRALRAPACRWCSPATTMSCRPTATSIRPSPTRRTRCSSRKAAPLFERILEQGWVDAIRALHPDAPMYTFWDYMRNRWQRDAGLRIDHLLLSPQAREAPRRGRRRPRRARRSRRRQRSCAGLGRAGRGGEGAREIRRSRGKDRASVRRGRRRRRQSSAGHCWSSTAIRLRTAPIMRLPKTILRRGGRPAGAILGFANFLLRFYRAEQPRAVLVGWDTLDAPTYRHEKFPAYQSGREFDDALSSSSSAAAIRRRLRLCQCQGGGLRGRRFPRRGGRRRRAARRQRAGRERRPRHVPACLRPARPSSIRCAPARSRGSGRPRFASATASIPRRFRISSRCAAIHPTSCRARRALGAAGAARVLRNYGTLEKALEAGRFSGHAERLRLFRSHRHHGPQGDIAAPCRSDADLGARRPRWRENGSSSSSRAGLRSLRPRRSRRAINQVAGGASSPDAASLDPG